MDIRLPLKITLPFVALFALLLFALGVILAREILSDVELRVESEQRFVLEVAAFSRFGFSEESLRVIRDRAAHLSPSGVSVRGEFVVMQDGVTTMSTFDKSTDNAKLIRALETALKSQPELAPVDETIKRHTLTLENQRWLMLCTERTPSLLTRTKYFLLYPYSEIEQAKNRALQRIVLFGSLGIVAALALGFFLGHWISRPVRRLASAAKRISAGGLNEPLEPALQKPASGGDEIAELTRAFQSMVESLRHSQEELLKAERLASTGKLAASVAHEIRNPLTSMRMTLEMLQMRMGKADESTQEAFRILLSEIDRLALSVEELLTFARPRPAQRVAGNLNQLVRDVATFLERQMSHARVACKLELDEKIPPGFTFDASKLRQLLVNLILNALQAVVRDGTITLRTEWKSDAVVISVHDTGPGIAESVRDKLFDLFVTTKQGGGGLGLAIARQVAEEHGGTLTFTSKPGSTVFEVALPS